MASYRPFPPPPLSQPHLPPPIPNPNHHHQHFPPNPNPNYYNQLPFAPPPPQSYYPPPPPPPNVPPPPPANAPPPPPPEAPPMHLPPPPKPTAVPPNKRAETEEERRARKKREYEKQKALERQKLALKQSQAHVLQKTKTAAAAAAGAKVGVHVHQQQGNSRHHHHGASGSKMVADKRTTRLLSGDHRMVEANRLKKPSTFICKLRFRNELPDPTAQPKLLPLNTDKDRYTKYAITSLERNYKPKYYPEPDLGIPLDLLDLSVYNPPAVRPPLDPDDEELLRDTEIVTPVKRDGIRIKERPTDKGVSWLVKTQYISPLSMDSARQSLTEKQAKELREAKEGKNIFLENLNSREKQIQAIEESFKAAKLPPVHQSNRSLKPVEILPLLPDLDRYDDQLVVVGFDGDPTADSEAYNKIDKSVRDEIESQAIMKSFVVNGSDPSKHEKFLAYMVPATNELSKNIYDEDEDVTYSWLREYHWDVRGDDTGDPNTYLVNFGDKDARYLPLPTKLVLQKKRAKEGRKGDEIEHYPVPSRITVRKRSAVAVLEYKESGTSSNYKKGRYSEQYESNSRQKMQQTGSMDQFSGDEDMSD